MSACEKCWEDASAIAAIRGTAVVDEYYTLLEQREERPCSPEEMREGNLPPLRPPANPNTSDLQ